MEGETASNRLNDQVALVTGSTHGIGLGIASRFTQEGASVVINDNGTYDGTAIAEQLQQQSDAEVMFIEADVREPESVQRLITETINAFERIDILVNNVGGGRSDTPADLSLDDWMFTMETTLRSGWLCTKHALEHMPEGASIINISSVHSHATTTGHFPYNVAKAGVNGLTRALAVELSDLGIRANAISPGAIFIQEQEPEPEQLRQTPSVDPVGRMGTPDDIGGLAVYLASDDASYITGTVFPADGGRLAVQQTTSEGR